MQSIFEKNALNEAYRELDDNLTILKNCIKLKDKNPSLAAAAEEIQQEYTTTKDKDSLDERVQIIYNELISETVGK